MDENTAELVARLCTRTGMIIEDASANALTIGHREPGGWAAAI